MFGNLLVEYRVWKVVLIDTVYEVGATDVVSCGFTAVTDHRLIANFAILNYFFEA